MNIVTRPAPASNYMKGRSGKKIDLIVVHWIVGDLSAADAVFLNGKNQVTAHYAVGEDRIHKYVAHEDTAYHAGNWEVNLRSIGIEHRGGPNLPITDKVYRASAELIAHLALEYNIPLDRNHIKPHKEFKATQCPGTLDIDRLISEAKRVGGDSMNKQVTLDSAKFEELVTKATKYDEFTKLGVSVEEIKRLKEHSCPPSGDPKAEAKLKRIDEVVKQDSITKIRTILSD